MMKINRKDYRDATEESFSVGVGSGAIGLTSLLGLRRPFAAAKSTPRPPYSGSEGWT